jgi:preprotein translocase subunit SecE
LIVSFKEGKEMLALVWMVIGGLILMALLAYFLDWISKGGKK